MKKLQTLLIILAAALFFTACEKDETPEVFDTISGVLSAGENVSAEDIKSLSVYIAKLDININVDEVTTETSEFIPIASSLINTDGSFSFTNLENGNYIVALSEDYMFPTDTFLVVSINGNSINQINNTVDRIPAENKSKNYKILILNYTDYVVSEIQFYSGDKPIREIEKESFTDVSVWSNKTVELLEFKTKLDKNSNVQFSVKCLNEDKESITSERLGFFSGDNNATGNKLIETPQGDLLISKDWFFGHQIELYESERQHRLN